MDIMDQADIDGTLFSRIQGLFETGILCRKKVTIIGLGSGGSCVATELAKCGVSHFNLIDYDILKLHNVIRHVCGTRDVGRLKTDAVKDAILNINPEADVSCIHADILEDESVLHRSVRSADLVLICTDSERSKYRINQYCIRLWQEEGLQVPAIYAGAYERAFGGDIMRVIPGETPCYDCVIGAVQNLSSYESKPKGKVDYSNIDNSSGFKAEPGLGLDVYFIALIQAKVGLLTLLRGSESKLEDIPYNFLMWGNRKEWIFTEPFKCIYANTEKREDCPTCGSGKDLLDQYGIDPENVEAEAEKLLHSLPQSELDVSKIYPV